MEIQATPTYQQVSDAIATLTQYHNDTCDYTYILEENQRLWEENEKLKKKLKKLMEECVCVGCGSSQVKYTKCGGEDGVNMCEECFT